MVKTTPGQTMGGQAISKAIGGDSAILKLVTNDFGYSILQIGDDSPILKLVKDGRHPLGTPILPNFFFNNNIIIIILNF